MIIDPRKVAVIEELKHEEREEKIRRYKNLNKLARKGQIVFCGSSLMEQFPIHELLADLESPTGSSAGSPAGIPLAVYNRGVSGYTTVELAERLDTLVFDLEPAHVFINIGTNDLNAEQLDLDGLLDRYDMILTRIRENLPDARLYILAYYPCNHAVVMSDPGIAAHFQFRTNDRVRQANEAVRSLAQKHHAQFLDLNAGITDEDGSLIKEYTTDGIHIFGEGYMKVLEELLPTLRSLQ
ncbi:MAG: lysophospholipase [Oscillospiraceae bacterium]|nr:lysophospholipase [Oscillospiraceae bacterium]